MSKETVISKFASVHESAKIGDGCYIGDFVSIEANAIIGEQTRIEAFTHIYENCELGKNCYVGPHCVIGTDGFGYAQDQIGRSHYTPQIGIVKIEDNVKILAHTSIDRAAFSETIIGESSIIGGHTHIAHNIKIGKNAKIWPGFVVAGSTKIGANVELGYRCNCVGHIEITDDFKSDSMVIINNSVKSAGHYAGNLLMKKDQWQEVAQGIRESANWELPEEIK